MLEHTPVKHTGGQGGRVDKIKRGGRGWIRGGVPRAVAVEKTIPLHRYVLFSSASGPPPLPLFSLAHFTQSVSAPLTTFHGIPHRDRSKLGLGCTVRWSLSRNGCSGAGLGHCECKVADATGRFEKKKFVLDLTLSLSLSFPPPLPHTFAADVSKACTDGPLAQIAD